MSKNASTTKTTTKDSSSSKAPSHIVYHVRDGKDGGKGFWTRIGAAWVHSDGNGFSIQVEVVPLDGRITLRVAEDQKE